jgi:hypothetical protein
MIRPATHNDAAVIIQLVDEFFSHGELDDTGLTVDFDTLDFFIRDAIEDESMCILVAEDNGQIIGAIAGAVRRWMFNYDIKVLHELGWFIPKQYRKDYPKAAFQLLRGLKTWGKAQGATVLNIVSTTREESPRVMEFYRGQGLRNIDSNFVGRL